MPGRSGWHIKGVAVYELTGANVKRKVDAGVAGGDEHCAVVAVVADEASFCGVLEGVDGTAAYADDVVEDIVSLDAFVGVIVTGENGRCAPFGIWPLNSSGITMLAGRVGRVVNEDKFPGSCGCLQTILEPLCLRRIGFVSIWFPVVAIERKDVYWTTANVIISFVAGQGEVIQVGLQGACLPVVITGYGKEAIFICSGAVLTLIISNELVIVLANVGVYGLGCTIWIVVIACGNDEVGLPVCDQAGNVGGCLGVGSVVANDSKAEVGRAIGGAKNGGGLELVDVVAVCVLVEEQAGDEEEED